MTEAYVTIPNEKAALMAASPIQNVDRTQAAMTRAFRFLRQPSRLRAPSPVAKRGRAVGIGAGLT
jgi:hypothetical protein